VPGAELDLAARSVIDSIYIEDVPARDAKELFESVYVITQDREVRFLKYDFPDSLIYDETSGRYVPETPKYIVADIRYNVEQDNYMWYLRRNLMLPDVRLSQLMQAEDRAYRQRQSKKGLFKRLFRKKKKDEVDSASLLPPPKSEDEFDFIDENESVQPDGQTPAESQKQKKGLFSFLKKKPRGEAEVPDEPKEKKKKEKKPKNEPAEKEQEEDDGF
jgi:hypothetical protein